MASEALIALGQVVSTHATHGELRVRLYNPHSTTLRPGLTVTLRRGEAHQQRRIRALRPHHRVILLTLDGCDSMTAAEALVGYEVCVPEHQLPALGTHEVYHYQLIGMTVVTTAGEEIGTVAEVIATGGNDVCVVRARGREHLIPLIGDVVRQVDRSHLRLVIEPVPGLLDG